MDDVVSASSAVGLNDTETLHQMGYAQELKRGMGSFSNFAVSFSIISILTGGITTYYLGMDAGGPFVITIGWFIVGALTLCVGLGMAEICSAYPTAGGLYYWSARLATKNKAAWSWACGWFNLVGQVAVTASIDYGLATYVGFIISLYASSFHTNVRWTLVFYAIILIAHGALNTFRVRLVSMLADISAWWHFVGTIVIVGALLIIPSHHQSVSFLFHHENLTGWTGPFAGIYAFSIGLLLAQYTLTGYDASAHMTEETHGAAISGPKSMVRAIYISIVAGFVLNLAMTFAIQGGSKQYDALALNGTTAGGQIFVDAITGAGGKLLVLLATAAMFFCGLASVTANSRMIYAFSRDGAVPGHRLWHRLHPQTRTPVNAVWLAVVAAFILGLPSLYQVSGSSVAFFAIVSIGTVGLYVAYVIPIFLRLRAKSSFVPGPWNLGKWSTPIGVIAIIWVIVITILFFAPAFYPWTTAVDINWAGPVFVAVMAAVFIWYGVSAHKWFTGPKIQGDTATLKEIEKEYSEGVIPAED
ncbi:MAG TPA: amino acid permease [Acidimicrobiales bacterium]|jgi:amino acid transporter|nr:amino acid permease [Acidimicrobiales bacterium]